MLQSLFVCRRLLTGGTVIPVSLIAVVPTVLEKSVFYGYLAVASVSLGLPTQFVHGRLSFHPIPCGTALLGHVTSGATCTACSQVGSGIQAIESLSLAILKFVSCLYVSLTVDLG